MSPSTGSPTKSESSMSDTANGNAVAARLSLRKLAIATLAHACGTSGDMDRLDGEVRASGRCTSRASGAHG